MTEYVWPTGKSQHRLNTKYAEQLRVFGRFFILVGKQALLMQVHVRPEDGGVGEEEGGGGGGEMWAKFKSRQCWSTFTAPTLQCLDWLRHK